MHGIITFPDPINIMIMSCAAYKVFSLIMLNSD